MNLRDIKSIYFIGIGGIGMSALARYFNANGRTVSGYDKTPTPLTNELEHEGMDIHFTEDVNAIPKKVDLVVYTPAMPADHKELVYYRANNYTVIKRSDLLEELTKSMFTIAVAGTHGKTTTTSMIAHLLKASGFDCTAFLGGVTVNYDTNFLAGKNNVVVVEADEYDRSFHKLHPDISVITSADPDHLDIYGTDKEVIEAFRQFAHKLKPGGNLIIKHELPFTSELKDLTVHEYSLTDKSVEFYGDDQVLVEGTYSFTFHGKGVNIDEIHLSVAGLHNVENAIAACAVGTLLNINPGKIKEAIQTFRGVKRRFEYIIRQPDFVYIDDYAHHPNEIKAFLTAVKAIYPDKKITCIFQPHLYTRTRDFATGFAESLGLADELLLLPIYPARELPIAGVTSEMILELARPMKKAVVQKNELLAELKKNRPEVLVTVGAGDIDTFIEKIREDFS